MPASASYALMWYLHRYDRVFAELVLREPGGHGHTADEADRGAGMTGYAPMMIIAVVAVAADLGDQRLTRALRRAIRKPSPRDQEEATTPGRPGSSSAGRRRRQIHANASTSVPVRHPKMTAFAGLTTKLVTSNVCAVYPSRPRGAAEWSAKRENSQHLSPGIGRAHQRPDRRKVTPRPPYHRPALVRGEPTGPSKSRTFDIGRCAVCRSSSDKRERGRGAGGG
jgi:hypothetical protein